MSRKVVFVTNSKGATHNKKFGHILSRLPVNQVPANVPTQSRAGADVETGALKRYTVPTTKELETRADQRNKYTSTVALHDMYDWCSVNDFDFYHRIFYTWHWVASVTAIILSTISGVLNGPNLVQGSSQDPDQQQILALTALVAGVVSGALASITQIVNVKFVADECKYARAELAFYLTESLPMPRHVFDRIAQIGLLCFPHPRKCRTSLEKRSRLSFGNVSEK